MIRDDRQHCYRRKHMPIANNTSLHWHTMCMHMAWLISITPTGSMMCPWLHICWQGMHADITLNALQVLHGTQHTACVDRRTHVCTHARTQKHIHASLPALHCTASHRTTCTHCTHQVTITNMLFGAKSFNPANMSAQVHAHVDDFMSEHILLRMSVPFLLVSFCVHACIHV